MAVNDLEVQHYIVGGGAEQSAEQARRVLYGHQMGSEGVCEPGDLQVRPLAVPGGAIRVAIGSAFIISRAQGAVREMYFGSVTREQTVAIPANQTSSTRHDLIVMRVRDPYVAGNDWDDPGAGLPDEEAQAARAGAQYIFIERIPSVPASARRLQDVPNYETDTAYTLARVSVPAMTGTILTSHITNLREVHTVRRSEVVYARPRVAADDGKQNYLTGRHDAGGEFFPGGGGFVNEFQVDIPSWANRMVIDASWMTIRMKGNPWGYMWIEFGDEYRNHTWPNKQQYEFNTQHFHFGAPATSDDKTSNWLVMDEVAVPAKLRGKRVTFVFKASRQDYAQIGSTAHTVFLDSAGGLGCRLTFTQAVFDDHMV